ncbi:MAG: aminoglycoside phosphotransferase family protein [Candidatus Hecatellales archaeon]|nr:MAG: aminoglycoside phosphotransferase family protein [Candidatus Hecatellales archaeon]
MTVLKLKHIQEYLLTLYGSRVKLTYFGEFGGEKTLKPKKELKGFGYGKPYLLEFKVKGKKHVAVLETMRKDSFGHDYPSDRAQNLILAYQTYGKLAKHAKALDLGIFTRDGRLRSLDGFKEFFILVEKVEGREYHYDLEEISKRGKLQPLDVSRCKVLSDYLTKIHAKKKNSPELYVRRVRDLVGHGECIMGLIDNYPLNQDFVDVEELKLIEKKCVDWRWKLKTKTHRLCQVHGDFHPWNILFQKGTSFRVLDRSRGEWGEAADDISSLTINYIFFSLQTHGKLENPFKELFELFIGNYLEKTGDEEVLEVIQPFYAWRSLVLANPIWYPTLTYEVRRKLLSFALNILDTEKFDFKNVNSYMSG